MDRVRIDDAMVRRFEREMQFDATGAHVIPDVRKALEAALGNLVERRKGERRKGTSATAGYVPARKGRDNARAAEGMRKCRARQREDIHCVTVKLTGAEIAALTAQGILNVDKKSSADAIEEIVNLDVGADGEGASIGEKGP